jgi:hypothetical protein
MKAEENPTEGQKVAIGIGLLAGVGALIYYATRPSTTSTSGTVQGFPHGVGKQWGTPTTAGGGTTKILLPGAVPSGQSFTNGSIAAQNGGFQLLFLTNGNLVVATAQNQEVWVWESNIPVASGANHAIMQADGNFVLYNNLGIAIWATNTSGNPGAYLRLQSTGELNIYSAANQPIWSSTRLLPGQALFIFGGNNVTTPVYGQGIYSPNGNYQISIDPYKSGALTWWYRGTPGWNQGGAGLFGAVPDHVIMQTDGNLVLYSGGEAVWSSGTSGNPGAQAVLQNDGNFVIYSASGRALWNTGTA